MCYKGLFMALSLDYNMLKIVTFHFCISTAKGDEESPPFYLQPMPCTTQRIRPQENLQFIFCLLIFMHDKWNVLRRKRLMGSNTEWSDMWQLINSFFDKISNDNKGYQMIWKCQFSPKFWWHIHVCMGEKIRKSYFSLFT